MTHSLPDLPYAKDALAPHVSAETLEYHYGKHHLAYVTKLNELIRGTQYEDASLEEIIRKSEGGIFNNGAQVWNHTFYWHCLSPAGGGEPKGKLAEALTRSFGSFDKFKEQFTAAAVGLFGAGWVWLARKADGGLEIVPKGNAGNPLRDGQKPLLTCDVWEHAYYIDYRNLRAKYLETFWKLVNWEFVGKQFSA
ncbi:MAG TPA: Fe-Mn family superoxide dismutase [candidate division Zixibacteria bacterium]|nr:superoxide dismutase [Fe] [candidate division Zixibacteria bacterium]MDD4918332.1 Fe-Mn family superoxide dismutase [candidate division Zixibacteria bacterium]MDM7974038.1 Fe-Mn family superoxide dismutase [candidate division Zixibacteria bacterium]HOD67448.1 Fe-Mn family superoxide dismutase [candidate division Zixibacteria bacterium]HPM38333.1 Fe-Mn family superoxide dismutase [candidate division Zixibacteria bacterium]